MKSAILFFTALALFTGGGVYFLGEPSAKGQPPPVRSDTSIEKKFDVQISRIEDKVLQAEHNKPEQKAVTKVVYRVRKVPVVTEVLAREQKVLLNIQGDKYEVEPEIYKGYILIDVDSIQKAIIEEEADEAMASDTLSRAAMEHADEQIGLWKKFKSFFKHKK